jgi:Domain of unknown function (DUF4360)
MSAGPQLMFDIDALRGILIVVVKLLAVTCAALFSCLAFAPAPASAAPSSKPSALFTVQLLSVNGSGCPVGSATVRATSAATFEVDYSAFLVVAGSGMGPGGFPENCQLDVLVSVPSGWTYGIASEQYRGFAQLGTGAQGQLQASYYFSGIPGTYSANRTLSGPMSNDFEFDDQQSVSVFAPCYFTGTLNINTSLQVLQGKDPSFFNELMMSATDSPRLSFKQC